MATRKNRRCPLPEEGLPEVEPSSPPPSAESPRLPQPGRPPAPFRSNTGKDAAGCAASYLGIPAAPHHGCKQRSGPHPPDTPTRNRAVPRRGDRKRQTERRQWQQRKPLIGCAPGHPDPESDRSTARRQKTANGAGAMEATEAADRLRTRAPRHGIGPLNGESKESGRRSGGDGSNGAAKAAEASSASETA